MTGDFQLSFTSPGSNRNPVADAGSQRGSQDGIGGPPSAPFEFKLQFPLSGNESQLNQKLLLAPLTDSTTPNGSPMPDVGSQRAFQDGIGGPSPSPSGFKLQFPLFENETPLQQPLPTPLTDSVDPETCSPATSSSSPAL